jgi:regulatory protein
MDFDYLYLRVLKFLNFRPRSEKEVRDYLKKKLQKFPETDASIIDLIVHKLQQQKFLNDVEFARMWVRSRTEFKPKGKYLVKQELRQKGISPDIIDEVLGSDIRMQSEGELARDVLERKKMKYEGMEPQERFAKAGSFLARRGFSLDAIRAAIDGVFGKMV